MMKLDKNQERKFVKAIRTSIKNKGYKMKMQFCMYNGYHVI